ncbi:MAG: FHA domain-containing protein [Victivallales bacterium]|nr:FHA domain-containing protein [Victivallales bacterium]
MAGTPKLIILSEQLRGQRFELSEDFYSCGRVQDRDICIPDPTISTHHCDFVKRDGAYALIDNGSTNGTRVNNIPIVEQVLQNADILQIGGIEILYDCDDKSMTSVIKTQTGISLGGSEVGISTVNKMENFDPFAKRGKDGKSSMLITAVVVFLVLLVVVLLGILAYFMFFKQKPSAQLSEEISGRIAERRISASREARTC